MNGHINEEDGGVDGFDDEDGDVTRKIMLSEEDDNDEGKCRWLWR